MRNGLTDTIEIGAEISPHDETTWLDTLANSGPCLSPTATLALGFAGFGAMALVGKTSPRTVGDVSDNRYDANVIIPAPQTFSIWGAIYSGMGTLLIYQALPAQRDNPRLSSARLWLAAAPWANATWIGLTGWQRVYMAYAAQLGLWTGGMALHRALGNAQSGVGPAERWLRAPISLYAGWLNVAQVLSLANFAIDLGWSARTPTPAKWGGAALIATAAGGTIATRKLNDPWFGVPFVVAFTGLAAKKLGQTRKRGRKSKRSGAPALAKIAGTLAAAGAAWLAPKIVRWAIK